MCAIEAKTVVVVALNHSVPRNIFGFLALMQVKLPQDLFPKSNYLTHATCSPSMGHYSFDLSVVLQQAHLQ